MPTKRLLDLAFGTLLLAGALLPMAAVAILVRLTSAGPVLYRQRRVGLAQREFTLFKFRTMREDAERDTGEVMAVEDDPRLTPIGALLRKARPSAMSAMSAVSRATSVPAAPIAIPTVAVARAGASFTPSPTKAAFSPLVRVPG